MYPYLRYWRAMASAKSAPKLPLFAPHVSRHICWPWDTDPWRELNNGRTLTLYDLGRVPTAYRMGILDLLGEHGYVMAIAGSTIRYRMRVRAFERVEIVSRLIGWDARFFYYEQSMWKADGCTSHVLLRAAVSKPGVKGIVSPAEIVALRWPDQTSPPLPAWVEGWIASENQRPWPPTPAPSQPQP